MSLSHFFTGIRSAPTIIDTKALANQTSDLARSLSINCQIGDLIFSMTANRAATAPPVASGFIDLGNSDSVGSPRSLRLQYKFATSTTETIEWTGAYGYITAIRNASVVNNITFLAQNSVSTALPLPDITNLNTAGYSLIIGGSYVVAIYSSVTTPYTLINSSNLSNPAYAAVLNNTSSSHSTKTLSLTASAVHNTYVVEIF